MLCCIGRYQVKQLIGNEYQLDAKINFLAKSLQAIGTDPCTFSPCSFDLIIGKEPLSPLW